MYLALLLFLAASVPSPDGMRIYSTSPEKGTLTVTDPRAAKFVRTYPVGPEPTGLAVSPDGRRLFICIGGKSEVDVIDTASMSHIKTIPVGAAPQDIYLTPDATRMIALSGKKLSVINVRTMETEFEIPLGGTPESLAIDSDKNLVIHRLIVKEIKPDRTEVVDYATRKVVPR